jgi:cytochrome c biogenesis protein CcmG, thiol:disulfide interchange protein DsbE
MTLKGFISRIFGSEGEMTHIVAGNKAAKFSLQDSIGKNYSLSALLEKGPVVAAFFKVSCPVCQFTFPFLERLHHRYGKTATFLGISQDDAKATNKFINEYGVTFPVALDESGKNYPASNAYGLTNVPTIFLIESDATIKVVSNGFNRKELEEIAASLAERQRAAPAALFRPDERVPNHKPG